MVFPSHFHHLFCSFITEKEYVMLKEWYESTLSKKITVLRILQSTKPYYLILKLLGEVNKKLQFIFSFVIFNNVRNNKTSSRSVNNLNSRFLLTVKFNNNKVSVQVIKSLSVY